MGQPFLAALPTALRACVASWRLLGSVAPGLLLCNGPGTCLPLILAARARRVAHALRLPGVPPAPAIVYVESVCRVNRLSLTGRIVHAAGLADAVLVQWEGLAAAYPGTTFVGLLL